MRVHHPRRLALCSVAAIVVAIVAYAGWLVWDSGRALAAAADDARAAKAAVSAADPAAASRALDDFSSHASTAAHRTDSPVWSLLTKLPAIGDDAEGVRAVSQAADALGAGGLDGLARSVGDMDAFVPHDGTVDVQAVERLQQPVADVHRALAAARVALSRQDPRGFVGPLRTKYLDLQRQIASADDALTAADRTLRVLPVMLGADGPRSYLLVMQNNAEIRATGGLPGSVSLIRADKGRISMVKQATGTALGHAPAPVLPLTAAERTLFGDNLGRYFLDGNLTPDFPRSAALWKARWQQVEGGEVDGVVSVDTVTLSYLLRALGPITVDGVRLTGDNVVDELLHNAYVRIAAPADQDVFFRDVAVAVFDRLTSFGGSRSDLVDALRRGATERRVLVHDFDPAVQGELAGTAVAGELTTTSTRSPQVGIYFADGTLGKMSYYLRYGARVTATSCQGGVQSMSGRLTVRSTAPKDAKAALPEYVLGYGVPAESLGSQLVVVQIFAPEGGKFANFDTNGLDFDQTDADFEGRPVRTLWVLLKPGEVKDLSWTMTSGPGQTGAGRLSVTPSIEAGSKSMSMPSAC
ncbi:DUF4012 domain-containing protein [Nocardioides panacihumi]|uniref:DUF4012 domain-containing protein n=1 Tax=Nocardioides panacihumi TaxID=400774 RepID=A0ABN2Q784_9ACTN